MLVTKIILTLKNREIVLILWIFLSAQRSAGLTECGWIFRNGLLNPELSRFTASFNLTAVPVVNADKAWCIPVKNHSLTVDLGSFTNVTRLAVQGENGTNDYVTAYEVDYSEDGEMFINIKNGLKPQCSAKEFFGPYPGLSTGSDIAESNLTVPFGAQYVRFRPQESVGNLCTRVDIYGCQSDEGFTEWSPWTSCFLTPQTPTGCGRSRNRACERRKDGCKGAVNETEGCTRNQCPRDCGELGIVDENRSINDTAFEASSFKPGFEPFRARLNGPSAWCAALNDQNQFLEIDLGGESEIKEIATQGLQSGNRSAWVTLFFLDFRRNDNSEWQDYTENGTVRIYKGNENGNMTLRYTLARPQTARFIRFYPLEWSNDICMRVSVSGCRLAPVIDPRTGGVGRREEVDEAFWVLLWILLGLVLLLLLLGLLYLCCRYCPCCACCGYFPCAKKRKGRTTDEAMMTELTSDEIDAPRVPYGTGITQTDSGSRLPETETQTLAIHLGAEDGRSVDTGALYFSTGEGDVEESQMPGAKYNEGFKYGEEYKRATRSRIDTSRREEKLAGTGVAGYSKVDGARVIGTDMSRERMMARQEERMRSSQYEREAMRSYQDSLTAESGGEQFIGRYEVETVYPGQATWKRNPLGPPPTVEIEVSPDYEDTSWRVERIEQVNGRGGIGAIAESRVDGRRTIGAAGRGVHDRRDFADVSGREARARELDYRGIGFHGEDKSERTITVHLGDAFPARLDARELESTTDRDRYFNEDTYRARRGNVETWKVDCIRGQAFENTVNVDTARGRVTGQPYQYHAPLSPTSSTTSSSSQFNGSSISEQFGDHSSKRGKYYKMFEYSRE